jgi:hypothetical protein
MTENLRQLRPTNSALDDALKARDEFLAANPELQDFQDEIDGSLADAGKKLHNREAALRRLFRSLAIEMQIECNNAQDECNKILEIMSKWK